MAKNSIASGSEGTEAAPWEAVEPGTVLTAQESAVVDATVVPDKGTALAINSPATMAVIEWCASKVSENDASSAAAIESMIRRALEADSIEDVLREDMTVDAKSILEVPILVTGIRIGESEFVEGLPYYVLFDCEYGNPRASHVVTCGGFMVVTQAMKLDIEDAWPQVITIKESAKKTRAGFSPLHLARPVS